MTSLTRAIISPPKGPKPEPRQNQFGGSIGGPIRRQKTFFFFDYENFRVMKGITADLDGADRV